MIGHIETKEIEIEGVKYQMTKLYAKDSYELYLQCLTLLVPFFTNKNKQELNNLNISELLHTITDRFGYGVVAQIIRRGIRKNYQEITESELNVTSPLLIMELFAHIVKFNVLDELLKKDIGAIVNRLTGSVNAANA
jgi:hypothetical protein